MGGHAPPPLPPPPHYGKPCKGGGIGPFKNWVTWGVRSLLLERGNKPEKGGGGVDVEMGDWHFFINLQFNHIYSV